MSEQLLQMIPALIGVLAVGIGIGVLIQSFRKSKYDYMPRSVVDIVKQSSTRENVNELVRLCYKASYTAGWHTDIHTGDLLDRNKGEMLCLIHSEISEAMEGERKGLMDDKLPHRKMAEVELADAVIRICDYSGRWGFDLGGAIVEKMNYNETREDHKKENRLKVDGKKF